jgi:hydroxysqualene synthase
VSVDHYENFPVASVLCPPALRPAVLAIYDFARTADDIADEGDITTETRLAALREYRDGLHAALDGRPSASRWPAVFGGLQRQIAAFSLPAQPLHDLLDAFEQDTHNPVHADRASLLDYCRRSANPIGRLLLHLYGIGDTRSFAQSDAVCTALQLINFWQDLSVDLPRGRHYVAESDLAAHGLSRDELAARRDDGRSAALVCALCEWARGLMLNGAPLALSLPGRAGWELRLVVQGGLRVLEKIDSMDHRVLNRRPALTAWDVPTLLWRAARMSR